MYVYQYYRETSIVAEGVSIYQNIASKDSLTPHYQFAEPKPSIPPHSAERRGDPTPC